MKRNRDQASEGAPSEERMSGALDALPDEVLLPVLRELSLRELSNASRVCRRLRNLSKSACRFRGELVGQIGNGGAGSADGQFNRPRGLTVGPTGEIYVVDADNKRVQVFSPTYAYVRQWELVTTKGTWFNDIAIGSHREAYVIDGNKYTVHQYSPTGEFQGIVADQDDPWGVCTHQGRLYVTSYTHVKIYSPTEPDRQVGKWGHGPGKFRAVMGVAVDGAGRIFCTEFKSATVQVFNHDGSFSHQFGGQGSADGQLSKPYGIAVSPDGRLVGVADMDAGVQLFTPEGRFERRVGLPPPAQGVAASDAVEQFLGVMDVAFTADGRLVCCDQTANRNVTFA
eukprot:TRINITY_DN19294_c0_g1_i1.p1 TRINITY_DN19294_c0_g1~~TRINITY_DN19294_c0_g1_i1.p1  ORF type:complete len:340 (+),score=54.32 TRINITY_DN19294_c0_g1_i1:145-1164(+)